MTDYVRTTVYLKDENNKSITTSGGVGYVATAGSAAKAAVYDADGVAVTNPVALAAGVLEFHTVSTVASVDLYIQAPGGEFITKKTVSTGTAQVVYVDTSNKQQVYVIPFSAADITAATETDTLFNLPAHSQALGKYNGAAVRFTVADATETVDFGTLSSESGGDANGLFAAVAADNAVQIVATEGALYSTSLPYLADAQTAKSLSVTTTAGTDTAAGFLILPIILE